MEQRKHNPDGTKAVLDDVQRKLISIQKDKIRYTRSFYNHQHLS